MSRTARFFLALTIVACLAAATTADAAKEKPIAKPPEKSVEKPPESAYEQKIKAEPFYENIVKTAEIMQGRDLLEYFDATVRENPALLPVITFWLRDNSINVTDASNINALYFLSYSDMLLAMAEGYKGAGDPGEYRSLYKTALLNLHIFELMGNVDGARCQDPTALAAVRAMLSERLETVTDAYKMFPRENFAEIEKNALREEDKYLLRPPNDDICSLGQARMIDLSKTPGMAQKIIPDPRYKDGKRTVYVAPHGYVYHPAIVPDGEWLKTRREILGEVTQNWAKRYAAAVK